MKKKGVSMERGLLKELESKIFAIMIITMPGFIMTELFMWRSKNKINPPAPIRKK